MRSGWLLVTAVLLSACTAAPQTATERSLGGTEDDLFVEVLVVDAEVFPVADASLFLTPGDLSATTDATGKARLGPVTEGDYALEVSKAGYGVATRDVSVRGSDSPSIVVTLAPITADVPYHASESHDVRIFCRWAIDAIGSSIPCNPVPEEATGVPLTGYECCFDFLIAAPNLANMLHDMVWLQQAFAAEMGLEVSGTELTQAQSQTYALTKGPMPLRTWFTPGEKAVGGDVEFVGTEGTTYVGSHPVGADNSTIPGVALAMEQRVTNWLTFFYNRAGPDDFTVLPDE